MSLDVSVVIPTRGDGRGLGTAVGSALSQSDVSVQVVVAIDADDAEDSGDRATLEALGPPHRVLSAGRVGRPGPLRSWAASLAAAPLVAFLDDDDEWVPDKLAKQIRVLQSDTRLSLVGSDAEVLRSGSVADTYHAARHLGRLTLREALAGNPFITSSVVTRHEYLRRVGFFPEGPDGRYCDDYVTWLKLLTLGYGVNLEEPLVRYRVDSVESLSAADPMSGEDARAQAVRLFASEADVMGLKATRRDMRRARRMMRAGTKGDAS